MASSQSVGVPGIKFIQVNLHRSPVAAASLSKLAKEKGADVILIQEPPVRGKKVCGLTDLSTNGVLSSGAHPTSAIAFYGLKPIVPFFMSELSSSSHCVVRLSVAGCQSILVVSAYHTPTVHDNTAALEDLRSILGAAGGGLVLVGGDFNARSRQWGDCEDSMRGQRVEDFCASEGMFIMNDAACGPTFARANGECSYVDLSLCSFSLARFLGSWTVGGCVPGSDHNYIMFEVGEDMEMEDLSSIGRRFDTRRADWECFDETYGRLMSGFESRCAACSSKEEVQSIATMVVQAVAGAAEMAIPRRRARKRACEWWCQELSTLRRAVRTARNRYGRATPSRRSELRAEYISLFNRYKTLIAKRKADTFRSFCERSSHENPFGRVYKLFGPKALKRVPLMQVERADGTFTGDEKETCAYLLERYFEDPDDQLRVEQAMMEGEEFVSGDDHDFAPWEVDSAIRKLGNAKAPGPDNISVPILKRAHNCDKTWFVMFFNLCLRFGCFPAEFKIGSVVLLPKTSSGDAVKTYKMFRPICLFPYLGKVLDRLFIGRVNWYMWSRRLLSERQFGFRPQVSSSDAVYELVETIRNRMIGSSWRQKMRVLAVSVDAERAFDSVRWPDLLEIVAHHNCPKNLYHLLCDYLRGRKICLELKSGVFYRNQKQGCAQGTPSGPFLWNIFYNDLISLDFGADVLVFGFADDLLFLVIDKASLPISHLRMKAERVLSLVSDWAAKRSIVFNPRKSKAVLFTKTKHRVVMSPGPLMGGEEIKVEESLKYLGVTIDWKLMFTQHIDEVCGRAKEAVNKLSAVCAKRWGITSGAMLTIYRACVEPMLSYALLAWADRARIERNRKKLEAVQRFVLIRVARAYSSASLQSLCVLTNVAPIDLRLDQLAILEAVRTGRDVVDCRPNTLGWVDRLGPLTPVSPFFEGVHPALRRLAFGRWNHELEGSVKLCLGLRAGTQVLLVTTGGGAARNFSLVVRDGAPWRLLGIKAVLDELWRLQDLGIREFSISLPLELFPVLRDWTNCDKWVMQFYEFSLSVSSLSVSFAPSRCGEIDLLDPPLEASGACVELSFVKKNLEEALVQVWNRKWGIRGERKVTTLFFPSVTHRRSCPPFGFDFLTTQYVTGHGNFNQYVAERRDNWSPYCQFCGEVDDAAHRLLSCSAGLSYRQGLPVLEDVFISKANFDKFREFILKLDHLFG